MLRAGAHTLASFLHTRLCPGCSGPATPGEEKAVTVFWWAGSFSSSVTVTGSGRWQVLGLSNSLSSSVPGASSDPLPSVARTRHPPHTPELEEQSVRDTGPLPGPALQPSVLSSESRFSLVHHHLQTHSTPTPRHPGLLHTCPQESTLQSPLQHSGRQTGQPGAGTGLGGGSVCEQPARRGLLHGPSRTLTPAQLVTSNSRARVRLHR